MSYPHRGNYTWHELHSMLVANGVSLCQSPRWGVPTEDGGVAPANFLSKPGCPILGVKIPKSGKVKVTWVTLESIATNFKMTADDFGLTAGWPNIYSDEVGATALN
jgi:hypothetical protein